MKIAQKHYGSIADIFPHRKGNVVFDDLQVINAVLYVTEHRCRWRCLPEEFGNWHAVYTRVNRWGKKGLLDRIFLRIQESGLSSIKIEAGVPDNGIANHTHPEKSLVVGEESRTVLADGQPRVIWLPRLPKAR